jgi:polyisoprenoid-binding protein YceI
MKLIIKLSLFFGLMVCGASLWAGNFQVDKSNSEVAADAKASPPHSFTNFLTDYEYDIEIDPESLTVSRAVFEFNFANLDSKEEKRDKKMKDWMDIAVHPSARFEMKNVIMRDGATIGSGTFFMHGVSREIEVPFSVKRDGDSVVMDGTAEFDYMDWDLKKVRLFIFSVNPELKIRFHLVGELKSGR